MSAILIIAVALGAAFFLGLMPARAEGAAYRVMLAALAVMGLIAGGCVWLFATSNAAPVDIRTAGFQPPFSINLRMGLSEAALSLTVILTALLSAIALSEPLQRLGRRAMAVLLILTMALCGVIATRDIFNLFVFFELVVIATAGLVLLSADSRALTAGFKYLIVSQVISIFMLVGIIFVYHAGGSLNIDDLHSVGMMGGVAKGAALAFFLLFIAVVTELKPFPANGWALDLYESAHPAFSAIFSVASGAAALFAADKMLLLGGSGWTMAATAIGLFSFVGSNLFALAQRADRRLLGYSSIAQTGLLLAVMAQRDLLGDKFLYVIGGLLVAHGVGKAGLYWLSALVKGRELRDWAALRHSPWLILAFVTFAALLIGLPPFPGFYAKWDLMHLLAADGRYWMMFLILAGALLEAVYLMRWFGAIIKGDMGADKPEADSGAAFVVGAAIALGWGLGYLWGELSGYGNPLHTFPLLFALAFVVLERFPVALKNTLAIAGLVAWFASRTIYYDPIQMIFGAVMLIGGALTLLASYHVKGQRIGFYPGAMLMYGGLALLIEAHTSFDFFVAWELLTVGSYFLILRGKESEPHALSYILFSLGGAFAILAGFAIAGQGNAALPIAALGSVPTTLAPAIFILLALGFMTKTASIGLHIWLPGAHAEAETDVSPMVSGILLKAGLFGILILLLNMGKQQLYGVELTHVMLWIGGLSALLGNLMAIFQEDAKRLLAYSSIGQMGYALFGLALMNHLGWLMALMFVIGHFVYKAMLFLSVGGVAKMTGTRQMYRMGGLVKLMPLSFIAVLIGIIAVSGLPPLTGFAGRWIFYNAILDADTRLPMLLIFLAGPIAFLYLFRLIYTIFLGQLKDEHRRVKDPGFWIIAPQMIYVAILMAVAIFPGMALRKVNAFLKTIFPDGGLTWNPSAAGDLGTTISSQFGYWNPIAIMCIVAGIFGTVFVILVLANRRAQKVGQFNIAFAAERPYRPETTHFAWNFYAPYRKALGFLVQPIATGFWNWISDALHSSAQILRRIYTGNGQTYALHYVAYVMFVYLLTVGA
ncbi:putative NADH dehydrogenase [Magnetofaba australis IT-1]|uniref:Putative NADH dehydrogenase n=1 Tax=Magnetofaba australis IT-1 TaxID=1434232 RepID=A0A1Y2K6U7_9PROT|nr:putative NADH dehydrogenase [Magnetofaba australis IT-1]